MKASFTARITCSALAATLAALPCNEALAAPATAPATTAPATTAPATTAAPAAAPATTAAPAAGAPGTTPADPNQPTDAPSAITAPGETPTEVPGEAPAEAPVEETPAEPVVEAPPPMPEPVGPERPAEPTVANGKYKAKGTGLMIAGGALLGLGIAGVVTSIFLTKCDAPADTFSCKQHHNNTFAVPATGAAALLGAVLLAVGVGYRVRYKKWERWTPGSAPKTALYPTMFRGGAGVGYTVKF